MEVEQAVTEILEQAGEGQEIILEAEGDCEEGEIEEIVEIIEEIEEVDEDESEEVQNEELEEVQCIKSETNEQIFETTNDDYEEEVHDVYNEKSTRLVSSEESSNINNRSNNQIYDASADWEDEEYEQDTVTENVEEAHAINNDINSYETYESEVHTEELDGNERTEISRTVVNYEHSENQENSVVSEDSQQYVQQEVIQNPENNLIYTVLGSKKHNQSSYEDKNSDLEYVQVQRYREETLPDGGTIYYAVNDENGDTYVQAVEDNEGEYQYTNEEILDENNQEWEVSNQSNEHNQDQEEQVESDQVYLHEDEDGQLYFKNEHGQLQLVYLTEDGNYAIAENSNDVDSQEDSLQMQEDQVDENYVLPDIEPDMKQFKSKKRPRSEEDDDAVCISLIISEDENGQKRTQVIIPQPPEAKCDLCNKTFKSSLQLLKHNRLKHAREEDITTRNFPCDLCPKRFQDQNSLARHRKTHVESRPFQCLECAQSFPTENVLRKHLALHNPDSHPLPCIYCGRRFLDETSLNKHEKSHLAGEKRTFVCDICQKCFSNISDLNLHKKNHDPDRKFDCEVCGREFNRLNNLQRHMMVHQQPSENEDILSCNVCGITYKFSSSLTRHMVTTHMNPEKLRQQAEEQRKKRENNYRRYLENRKTYETQQPKRTFRHSGGRMMEVMDDEDDID